MAKWADFGISGKRYDLTGTCIEKVEVRSLFDDMVGSPAIWARERVISSIEAGHTFVTIIRDYTVFRRGDSVRIVLVNGRKYIRTDGNSSPSDNLGNLPDC